MKNKVKYLIFIGLVIFTFTGCKKKGGVVPDPIVADITKPTITITKPTAGQGFVAGNTITFQATFNDNKELKNYEILISKVVLGGIYLKNVPTSLPYSYTKSATSFTSGVKQQEINLTDIVIPANTTTTIVATGKYNFKVTCTDGAGNIFDTTIEININ